MKQYWLSWSGFDTYRKCPKKYKLTRVDKAEPPEPDSKHNAVIGSVVQRVFEDFYNEELWRMGAATSDKLLELVPKYFYKFLEDEHVDFDHIKCRSTAIELLQACQEMVPKVLAGIKTHKLLGPYAKSEVVLKVQLQGSYYLYGIVDFIIRQKDGTILMLDGKASVHRDKYVDLDQLYFYAILFHLTHGRYPDKLGIYYYHYADDEEKAFDWITPDMDKIRSLRQELVNAFTSVQKKQFKATPKASHCQWCPWEDVCVERQSEMSARREKKRWNQAQKGEETLPSLAQSSEGTAIIGFGGKFEPGE